MDYHDDDGMRADELTDPHFLAALADDDFRDLEPDYEFDSALAVDATTGGVSGTTGAGAPPAEMIEEARALEARCGQPISAEMLEDAQGMAGYIAAARGEVAVYYPAAVGGGTVVSMEAEKAKRGRGRPRKSDDGEAASEDPIMGPPWFVSLDWSGPRRAAART